MPKSPSSPDRRAFGRRESCIRAVVHIAGRPALHCIVRNYSEGGALLELPEPAETTQAVRLVIENHGIDTMCEVRHGRGNRMGVRFYTAIEIDALAKAAAPAPVKSEPVTGAGLRKQLFGTPLASEVIVVRKYAPQSLSA